MKKNTSRDRKNNNLSEIIKEFSPYLTLGLKKNNAKVQVEQVLEAILVIERMNAWIDGFKALLIRYETKRKTLEMFASYRFLLYFNQETLNKFNDKLLIFKVKNECKK